MQKLSVFIFIAFILVSCEETQISTVDYNAIELDSSIINGYEKDARQLYFHEIISNPNHPDYDTTAIDEEKIKDILKIIQAVYDTDIPERDTVFNKYDIHSRYCYSFNSISLKVASDSSEIQNLVDNQIPTGQKQMDSLLTTFEFDSVKTNTGYPDSAWLTLYCRGEYNMIPIQQAFADIPSVLNAEINKGCGGDGNNIRLDRDNNEASIIFSIGRNDCPSGCLYHKYWVFRIRGTKAEFVQSWVNGK